MANLLNRVWFTVSNTPGNATSFTASSAVTGGSGQGSFLTPSGASAVDGLPYDYVAVEGTSKFEVGRGSYGASGGTLSRDLVTESSAGYGVKETFTSACTVFLTARASSLVQVEDWTLFGAATDGNLVFDGTSTVAGLVPSAGVYTLTRDLFAANLTVNGTGKIVPGGYRIFANGTLDLTAAGAGGIQNNGANGNAGLTTGTGGTGITALTPVTGLAGAASSGGSSSSATVAASSSQAAISAGLSAAGGGGGAGGAGTIAGGLGTVFASVTTYVLDLLSPLIARGLTAVPASGSSFGGAAGGPDGTNKGGGGGSGGGGGAGVLIFAKFIKVSGAATGAIQAKGGVGGAGASPTVGNCGGGGGGGGGAGGYVYLVTRGVIGSATNIIDVSGGNGGNGGSGVGTGTAGAGGTSGGSGRAAIWNISTNTYSISAPIVGSANSGQTGGSATTQVSLP